MSYETESNNTVESKVDCSKVYIKQSDNMGDGAYAKCDIREGELVEKGIVRVININGNQCEYVFTWSEDRTVWAMASGCVTYYNTSRNNPNTKMVRYFDECRFELYALRDIKKDEELTHRYRSIN